MTLEASQPGTETGVVVWDVRKTQAPFARYEVHTESVSQVRFQGAGSALLSGSLDGLICELDVLCVRVRVRVYGHGLNAQPLRRAKHAARDLTAVGHQDLGELSGVSLRHVCQKLWSPEAGALVDL